MREMPDDNSRQVNFDNVDKTHIPSLKTLAINFQTKIHMALEKDRRNRVSAPVSLAKSFA